MLCPYCLHKETKVIDKRDVEGLSKRRRECHKCKKRFNTHELVDHGEIRVIKKDGHRETFNHEKLKKGILRACEKRPVSSEKIDKMLANIQEKLRKHGKEIKTTLLGDLVSKEMRKIDKVSYVRFASVYKDFTKLEDFEQEIKRLTK